MRETVRDERGEKAIPNQDQGAAWRMQEELIVKIARSDNLGAIRRLRFIIGGKLWLRGEGGTALCR